MSADFSLTAVIKAMIVNRDVWEAIPSFYEDVILRKEPVEKDRELNLDR